MNERYYWLAFSAFPGVGPVRFKLLVDYFGSAKKAWEASRKDLLAINFGEKLTENLDRFRRDFSLDGYAQKLKDKEANFLILTDEKYPKLLKEISDPPFVLYIKGNRVKGKGDSEWDINKSIAVVGTRKITQYGKDVTVLLTQELVSAGFTIVSGLAFGVDSVAHKATIEVGGKTVAVLGSGVDCCTPSSNQPLYNSIVKDAGCIISEYPLGQLPSRGSFPSRNRIIAGLSLGVLVTEGAEDSGALITADYALKFNRKVFAVPGPITSSLSKGPYKLISKGAKLVTTAKDILDELSVDSRSRIQNSEFRIKRGDTKEERKILEILQNEARHFDEIARETKIDSSTLGSTLSLMEMKGLVKSLEGGVFSIAS